MDAIVVATYHLFLSSQNRSSGTSSNFTTILQRPLLLTNPNNWLTVRVGSVEVPYSFKLINPTNNSITYQIIRNAITYSATIALSPGNYNILTFLDEFKTKLATSIQSLTGWDASALRFTYNRSNGFATLSFVPTDSIATTITLLSASSVVRKCLGFPSLPSFSYASPSTITPATSSQPVNVSQNTAIYVRSENITQVTNFENIVSQQEASDILAKCQIQTLPGTIIQWTNQADLELDISNKSIDAINLYLGDQQAYELDLGGLDWTCRLTIQEWSYKQDSHATDRPESQPQDIAPLLDLREKAIKRLQKLKSKVLPVDAPQTEAQG